MSEPSEYDAIGNMIRQSQIAIDEALATPRWRPLLRKRRLREAERLDRLATFEARTYLSAMPR